MYGTLFLGCEFLASFLPFYFVYRTLRKTGRRLTRAERILPIVFAVYAIAVFHVTGAGTIYEALYYRFRGVAERINLIPFSRQIDPIGYLLNAVMFLPLGILVPLIWRKMDSLPAVLLSGFGFSALIEASQLLSIRGTDVDDLILNTLGAGLGWLLHRILRSFTLNRFRSDNRSPAELPAYILSLYLGRCLLFNYPGLIRLVYGF